MEDTYSITSEWTKDETKYICQKLVEYNKRNAASLKEQYTETINLVLKDKAGAVMGGILCTMYMHCLYIDVLWVDEACRGTGYGAKLLSEAEKIAKGKGCNMIHTDTFSFQAPDFYMKNGYELFGVLDGFPDDIKRYYLKKSI